MRVFLDTSALKTGHATRGVGFYTKELTKALKKERSVALVRNEKDADVIHYPFFDLFFLTLPVRKNKPVVVTVHDVIPLLYPNEYKLGIRGKTKFLIQKKRLQNVDAIITDSETSRKDIVRLLNIPQSKVHVTHLAPAEHFKPITNHPSLVTLQKKYNLPKRFVLYVGDVNYNKNVQGLVRAFSLITRHPSLITNLVLVGKGFQEDSPEAKDVIKIIKQLNLENRVKVLGFVPDDDLVKIYNLADVVCQPSFYEGFGFPVLEAQACGVPVVASKTQCLVEMSGESAVFVNPKSDKEIAEGIISLIDNKKLRKEKIKQGLNNAKGYTWGKTAKETIAIYNRLLSQ